MKVATNQVKSVMMVAHLTLSLSLSILYHFVPRFHGMVNSECTEPAERHLIYMRAL